MEEEIRVELNRIVLNPSKPPEAAHGFKLTRVDSEVVLEVGFLDLTEIQRVVAEAKKEGSQVEPQPLFITHRFTLSPVSLRRLYEVVKKVSEEMDQADEGARE